MFFAYNATTLCWYKTIFLKHLIPTKSISIYRNIYFRGKNNEIIRSLNCQITSQSHFMLGNTTCHWQHHLLLAQSKERPRLQRLRSNADVHYTQLPTETNNLTHQLFKPHCLLQIERFETQQLRQNWVGMRIKSEKCRGWKRADD